jgi:hypothetical protein
MNLSCCFPWQFGSEEDYLRNFVVGEPGSQVFPQFPLAIIHWIPHLTPVIIR